MCSSFKIIVVDTINQILFFIKKSFSSRYNFVEEFWGKLVYILLNINYFISIGICYYILLMKSLNAGSINSYQELLLLVVIILAFRFIVNHISKKLFVKSR